MSRYILGFNYLSAKTEARVNPLASIFALNNFSSALCETKVNIVA